MMRGRLIAHLSVLIVLVLVLASCGGSETDREPEVEINPTASPQADGVAQITSTTPAAENLGIPGGPAIFMATAPNNEPIERVAPIGPAPTEPPNQRPTLPTDLDTDGDGFYTFEEFNQAVAALYPSFAWPDNYRIDPTTLLESFAWSAEQGGQFEVRGEYTIIGMRHLCAWQLAWLDGYREGDAALMTESLGQLQTVGLDNPMFDTSTRDYLREMFQRAELGDPAMIQQYVDGTCSGMEFITAVPATPPVKV